MTTTETNASPAIAVEIEQARRARLDARLSHARTRVAQLQRRGRQLAAAARRRANEADRLATARAALGRLASTGLSVDRVPDLCPAPGWPDRPLLCQRLLREATELWRAWQHAERRNIRRPVQQAGFVLPAPPSIAQIRSGVESILRYTLGAIEDVPIRTTDRLRTVLSGRSRRLDRQVARVREAYQVAASAIESLLRGVASERLRVLRVTLDSAAQTVLARESRNRSSAAATEAALTHARARLLARCGTHSWPTTRVACRTDRHRSAVSCRINAAACSAPRR